MPSTDTFGIDYPCVQDTITLSSLAQFANDVDTAFSTVNTTATAALTPPSVRVAADQVGPTLTAGVNTTITWERELWDTANMWTVVSPTLITIPTTGTYLATARITRFSFAGNCTGYRGQILLAGTVLTASGDANVTSGNLGSNITLAALVRATAGQTMTLTQLFTGTATANVGGYFEVTMVSTT
jgi:hypothetical protein